VLQPKQQSPIDFLAMCNQRKGRLLDAIRPFDCLLVQGEASIFMRDLLLNRTPHARGWYSISSVNETEPLRQYVTSRVRQPITSRHKVTMSDPLRPVVFCGPSGVGKVRILWECVIVRQEKKMSEFRLKKRRRQT
jgi:hypothetical protein